MPTTMGKPTRMSKAAAAAAGKGVAPVTPYLTCRDAAGAIAYYKLAFGAEELVRLPAADGRILHACLSINGGSVMLGDDFDGLCTGPTAAAAPISVHLIVDDADAWAARAERAGGSVVMPVSEQFWGDRYGVVRDPFGHQWSLSTPVRTLSAAELEEAARKATTA